MNAYLRFGLLMLCLSIAASAYAGSNANVQLTGTGGEKDGLLSNGLAHNVSHDSSSLASPTNSNSLLSAGQPGLPGNKYGGKGFSDGGDMSPTNPPLPPLATPIPEPDILLDLGVGLAAFATIWNFRMRA